MTLRKFDVPIPENPEKPFPIETGYCDIVCGFGRGSAELGIPTANVLNEQLPVEISKLDYGVYFGFASLRSLENDSTVVNRKDGRDVTYNYGKFLSVENGDLGILPVVLSIGKNPFYGNDFKTVELHIIHNFTTNFYGAQVKFNILGYIRPELDYTTKEALINDINTDIEIAKKTLMTEGYQAYNLKINS